MSANNGHDKPDYETALISGASRGIGRAIALRLSALGTRVLLLGRDTAALEAVVAGCPPGTASACAGDLRDPEFVDSIFEQIEGLPGSLDVLVNNAGATDHGPVHEADMERWREVLDLNFFAAAELTRRALPGMIERERGAVINISSINGRHTNAGAAIYAASKHALNGFGGCLFEDVREHGIKVSTIMPGFVDTDMTARMKKDGTRMIQPDDVADAVAFVLSTSTSCCPTEIVIRPQVVP